MHTQLSWISAEARPGNKLLTMIFIEAYATMFLKQFILKILLLKIYGRLLQGKAIRLIFVEKCIGVTDSKLVNTGFDMK